jgi:TonB family protein
MILLKKYGAYGCVAVLLHGLLVGGYLLHERIKTAGLITASVTTVRVSTVESDLTERLVVVSSPENHQEGFGTQQPHPLQQTDRVKKSVAGAGESTLLALLHDTIAAHQRYPASAIALQQSGIVGLSFCLTTEGKVMNLVVAHSSGIAALDRAAFTAVKESVPFSSVIAWLKETSCFLLNIQFVGA